MRVLKCILQGPFLFIQFASVRILFSISDLIPSAVLHTRGMKLLNSFLDIQ